MSEIPDEYYPLSSRDDEPVWNDTQPVFEPAVHDRALGIIRGPAGQQGGATSVSTIEDFAAAVYASLPEGIGLPPINAIISAVTLPLLASYDPNEPPPAADIERDLLAATRGVIDRANRAHGKDGTHAKPKTLTTWQLAQIMIYLHHASRIAPSSRDTNPDYDMISMYERDGDRYGTYTSSDDQIRSVVRKYHCGLNKGGYEEVLAIMRDCAPRVQVLTHPDVVATKNGAFYCGLEPLDLEVNGKMFHFEPKTLYPFDPALVFTTKIGVPYRADATSPTYTEYDGIPWEVTDWLEDMFDLPDGRGEGLPELIWEILSAVVRPHVRWGKTAWFYSEVGNNGKGTLCALMRNLLGPGAHASVPLSDFGKQFALEPLVRASAIIVDENDVGSYIDKAANMKAIVTNDIIQIDRKYRTPIAFQFFGFMVQCLNEFPLFRDKSESFYRRQLFVPFEKSFTGAERKYIKSDYLQRAEVLEYVLHRVLHMDHYELSEPPATKIVLEEYKESNDPVRTFWEEHRLEFTWDLLPFTFAYDCFKAWSAKVNPSGKVISQKSFIGDLVAIVRKDPLWSCEDKTQRHRPGTRMNWSEPLALQYDLKEWTRPTWTGPSASQYRGLTRNLGLPPEALTGSSLTSAVVPSFSTPIRPPDRTPPIRKDRIRMFTTTSHDETIAALRAKLEAAEAAKEAEETSRRAAVDKAKRHAADAHVGLVLALYDLLGVDPEHPGSRITRGRLTEVAVDRSEVVRTQRLYRIVEALAAANTELLEQLQLEDEAGREERRPAPREFPAATSAITDADEDLLPDVEEDELITA